MPRLSSRPAAHVRLAAPEDVPALMEIVAEMRAETGRSSRQFVRETAALAERLSDLIDNGTAAVLVAENDSGMVGMAVLTRAPLSSLVELPTLHMDYAMVTRRARRQGVGRALAAAAAAHAEAAGMEQLAVSVVPADREANRFYARLGFAPVVVRRVTQVAALRRKLATPERQSLVDDLTRRRLLRRPGLHRTVPGAAGGR